ncbi:MAG: hypothetical protein JW720_15810 [Sedimentisphaerales bacterium]|nr:hypothetical protein [Sedimentisphaerales bacterium]
MMRNKAFRLVVAAALFIGLGGIVGCEPRSNNSKSIFSSGYKVASGFEIAWTTQEDGTAFLVEETKNRILKTRSMKSNEEFTFSVAGINTEEEFEAIFGVPFAKAEFCLYFVPTGEGEVFTDEGQQR